jgi:hypothetical protein
MCSYHARAVCGVQRVFVALNPIEALGRVSLYNTVLRGRERLPYGKTRQVINLSTYNLPAMLASHVFRAPSRR